MSDAPIIEQVARAIAGQPDGDLDDRWRRKAKDGLRTALPWEPPAERLEAMARAIYEKGPLRTIAGVSWDELSNVLPDRQNIFRNDARAAYRADPIMRELYPEKFA